MLKLASAQLQAEFQARLFRRHTVTFTFSRHSDNVVSELFCAGDAAS